MPSPPNVLKTTPPPADAYADMGHDALVALAKSRGIELPGGYVRKDVIADKLRAQDGLLPSIHAAASERADQALAAPVRRYDVVYVARTHLVRMSRGEVVEIDGLKLAAEPDDFPPYWKLQS